MFGITKSDWKKGLQVFVPHAEWSCLKDMWKYGWRFGVAILGFVLGLVIRAIFYALAPLSWLLGGWLVKKDREAREAWKKAHGFS